MRRVLNKILKKIQELRDETQHSQDSQNRNTHMVQIIHTKDNTTQNLPARHNTTVLQVLRDNNVQIDYFCGGRCSCGTCFVAIDTENSKVTNISPQELAVLGYDKKQKKFRLACQVRILGNTVVRM